MKKAVVVHSGGMDSSLCLASALRDFASDEVLSVTFDYGQRHDSEIAAAEKICCDWGIDHKQVNLAALGQLTHNSLVDKSLPIAANNTMVIGRNGLFVRLASIYAHTLGGHYVYIGVVEEDCAGYKDCSKEYMVLMEHILRIDFADPEFEIRTPLVGMTKYETMEFGYELGVLEYLLQETVTCYDGIPQQGCGRCPSCLLRNNGIREFLLRHPDFTLPYEMPQMIEA